MRNKVEEFLKKWRVPVNLPNLYRNSGWTCWADFLGGDALRTTVNLMPYLKLREWARAHSYKTRAQWRQAWRDRKLPPGAPADMYRSYEHLTEWHGFPDFTGKKLWVKPEARRAA